jgi:hypothetical protein
VRMGVQHLLAGSAAGGAEEASAAASVSAAMGDVDVRAALAAAAQAFRSISFDVLTASDLDSNAAALELNQKAKGAQLGGIDYFFSHSWHDSFANKVRHFPWATLVPPLCEAVRLPVLHCPFGSGRRSQTLRNASMKGPGAHCHSGSTGLGTTLSGPLDHRSHGFRLAFAPSPRATV